MADEVTVQCSLVASKSGAYVSSNTSGSSFKATMTGADMASSTQTTTGSYVSIDKGAIGTIGYLFMRNISSVAGDVTSVSIDGTTQAFTLTQGGPPAVIQLNSSTAPKIKTSAGSAHDVFIAMSEA